MRRRIDEEDIVQSVFRTVWRRQQNGQMEMPDEDGFWRLLVRITLNKTCRAIRFNTAGKRSVDNEVDRLSALPLAAPIQQESPRGLAEKIDEIAEQLSPTHQRILMLRLEGHTIAHVARELSITRQTVYRCLQIVRERLERDPNLDL